MARCPGVHGVEQGVGAAAEALEPRAEGVELAAREVLEADLAADVERGADRVGDQVGRGGDAEQAEGEALVGRVLGPQVVGRADRGEEVVGAERQRQHRLDLVDEDDDRHVGAVEQLVAEEAVPAVDRGEVLVGAPEQLGARQADRLGDLDGDAEVPVVDRDQGRADVGKVDADAAHAAGVQPLGRAHAQAGLADLPRREDVAELVPHQRRQQLAVGLALDVEGAGLDRAADLELGAVVARAARVRTREGHGRSRSYSR